MNYVASCSFGKDSLAAIVAAERAGVHIDEAIYCRIMFDRETSAELPEHEEFIRDYVLDSGDHRSDLSAPPVKRS